MSKKKKSKHSFSKEEKELIHKMKSELKLMGISRDQWSLLIQEELNKLQKSKGLSNSKLVNKVKEGFGKVIGKVATKRFGDFDNQLQEFEEMLKQGTQDEMNFMNTMFSDLNFNNINNLGKHGTTMKKVPKKKKIIVDLDFLDNDDH